MAPVSTSIDGDLLDVQRVALGGGEDPLADGRVEAAQQLGRRSTRHRRSRAAPARSAPPSWPVGPLGARLEELVARRGEQQDRRAPCTVSSRWSSSSRNVGAATWMSSTIATSGRRLAIASSSLRIPQNSSGAGELGRGQADRRGDPVGDRGRIVGPDRPRPERCRAILPSATSSESSSLMPAALRTISAIGQNVTPSPYGRQRPRRTWLRPCAEARIANSRISRDLPTPASPTTVRSSHERVAPTSSERRSRAGPSPPSRPTNGVVDRGPLGLRRCGPRSSRYAATGSALPLSVSGGDRPRPRSGRAPGDRSARRGRSRRAPAACSSRAAVFTASPVTSRWPRLASPAITSPVLTPMWLLELDAPGQPGTRR